MAEDARDNGETIVVPTACAHDCGGRCILRVHVKDGTIVRVEADDGEEPQLRACVRGHAYRQRVYSADRLRYPMKRVGERGKGKFQRISWDEALDTVAGEVKRLRREYGLESVLCFGQSGALGQLHSGLAVPLLRLFYMYGGCTTTWGGASAEGCTFACRATYGSLDTGHNPDDVLNSRFIILWALDPARSIWKTNTSFYLAQAKEHGTKIVVVDPRRTDSAVAFASQWIPIRPGTDAAMLIAMAYVMINENLHDQVFLDRYTIGFDKFREYVMGAEDGVPKTPSWAEAITGAPAADIANLAREYATKKPAKLMASFAPGRSAYGEQYHRAAMTLTAMTGNIGIPGGHPTGWELGPVGHMMGPGLPVPRNPLEVAAPAVRGSLDIRLRSQTRVNISDIWDAILRGKAGGYPADIKMLYMTACNPVNQYLNTNKAVEALNKLEFIVVHEQFLTPTARFADILLPVNTLMERSDIARPWTSGPYYVYLNKAIDSLYESKSDLEICTGLASRLGVSGYNDKTDDEWLREIFEASPDMVKDIPDFEEFKKAGVHKIQLAWPPVAFEKQIKDPANNPFPTPSGKIEIYSQRLADLADPELPAIPKYIEPWESRNDPLAKKYPLQLVTIHPKTRVHSSGYGRIPWIKELEPHTVWINTADALARKIANGDLVRVFNDRGQMLIQAKVTQRIMPGVVCVEEGAWYTPDKRGVDRGGCTNVLTKNRHSPGGAFTSNTCLVEAEKACSDLDQTSRGRA